MANSGEGRLAVVVGCGPAGSLMAIYLARMGWRVSVYERRPDYQARVAKGGIDQRAYDIFLGPRGMDSMRDAGVEIGPGVSVELEGIALHGAKGGRVSVLDFRAPTTVFNRDVLSNMLHEHGAKVFPGLIEYNFEHKLVGVDFEAKVASFEKAGAAGAVRIPYGLLVGADGAWSGVRGEMQRAGFVTFKQKRNTGGGRMMGIIDELPRAKDGWDRYWHLWLHHGPGLLMSATPTPGGQYRIGIIIMTDESCAQVLNSKSEVQLAEIVGDKFPDLFAGKPMPEALARNMAEQEANHTGVETNCSAFHAGDSVVLIGDAAHSVWSNQGQGCNAALESCKVVAGLIDEHGGDLAKALPAFTALRKPDADAVAAISRRPFVTVWTIAKAKMIQVLHDCLPFVFSESAGTQMIRGTLPYAKVVPVERRENLKLAAVLAGVVGLAFMALKK
eukprot:evm.model.scf_693.7 EVM.evm.TU.scf_693.7   scf_693:48249-49583(-)